MARVYEGYQGVDDDVALDLKGIFRALLRRAFAIIAITLLIGVGTFVILTFVPPTYKADTKLLIENREVDLSRDRTQAPERAVIDQETVASQVQLLTSRDLIRRVAEKHNLADRSEFDGSRSDLLETLLIAVGIGRDPMRNSPEERVIESFMEKLKVYRVEGSRVVIVEFTSRDRQLAADVTNSIAEEYMALQGEAKRRTSEDQTRWLGEEIEKLRVKVKDAEAAVERYRTGNDLFVGENNATVARQQITDLNNAIAVARSDRATAESRVTQLRDLLNRSGSLGDAADVIDTETFRSLRAREIALRSRLSELSVALLSGHPQIKAVEAQIADINRQQLTEARRALATFENDARVAASRVVQLTDNLNQIKATSASNSESEVELRALEREAASQRNLLEGLLVRYREAVARQNAEVLPADARVISRAAVPAEPTFPKIVPLTIVATIAGLILSIAWVIAGEFLSGRALVRSPTVPARPRALPSEAAADAGHDGDGAGEDEPPAMTFAAARSRKGRPAGKGGMPVAPSVRSLYNSLIAGKVARLAVLAIEDAQAATLAIADLSRVATGEGTRVVVVDTVPDNAWGGGPGLSDLIAGEVAFGEIIRRNRQSRAHEISVGTRPLTNAMLASGMDTVLQALEHTYDLVVLDLGILESETGRFRLVSEADHVLVVGHPEDGRVERLLSLLKQGGIARVSVLASDDPMDEAA